jgi:tetratricopeptide (TPR) repeat protein
MEGSAVLSRSVAAGVRRGPVRAPFVQRYWAFLSYSHDDRIEAERLHRALERFRVPKALVGRRAERFLIPARLTPVFQDRTELAASDSLSQEIQEALETSRHLIVLCSPAAANSRWVDQEIRTFKRLRPDGTVLAVIVAGEPWACKLLDRSGEECFPLALREQFDEDGEPTGQPAEPIAADFRPARDGRELGLLKLVAGMLDVRLDELVQRDQLRRQRRMAGISVASVAGMLGASALAVTAIQSRNEAREQRREAESLVGFMIGDLKDKLEPIGSLSALDAVGSRVLAYYERQNTSDLSDEALAQRSKALTLMGDIAHRRGDLDRALRLYRQGLAGTAEALRRDPDNPQRLFDHAQNVFWIGEIARDKGDLLEGEAARREYKRLADRMVALEPGNPRWQSEARDADANLGILLFDQQRFAEASRLFRRSLQVSEALARRDPADQAAQMSLWESLAWLSDSIAAEGQLHEAAKLRERQVALITAALRDDPSNVQLQQRIVPALRGLARLQATQGDVARGLTTVSLAVDHAGQLLPAEPDNVNWMRLAAGAELDRAGLLLLSKRVGEASQQTEHACGLIAGIAARDTASADARSLGFDCLLQRARVALAAGESARALVTAGEALALSNATGEANPVRRAMRVASTHRLLGDIHAATSDGRAAQQAWAAALAAWPRVPEETPRQMAVRVELLRSIGRTAEAQALAREVERTGLRTLI